MKLAKPEVSFEHPAGGKDHCADCKHFETQGPHTCEIVAGRIETQDWCDRFKRKSRIAEAMKHG